MMNPDWERWIFASVSTFFDQQKGSLGMFVEGTDKAGRRSDKDYLEFRMDGPFADEVSKDYWRLIFEVNVLVCSIKDQKDTHRIYRNVGLVTTMFQGAIPIYKFGAGLNDNPNIMLGCAILEAEHGIHINHYGQFDPTLNVLQTTVEGSYKLNLDT